MRSRVGIAVLAIAFAGCRGDSGSVTPAGSLRITVVGAPTGSEPDIVVTGPAAFDSVIHANTTLTGLTPGSYHLSADPIVDTAQQLQASPAAQDVTVRADSTVDASVTYTETSGGSLVITVSGLPSDATPTITVSGTGYATTAAGNVTIAPLLDGTYTVSAAPVADGGVTYQPIPASQTVSVAGSQISVSIQYQLPTSALTLNVDGAYINQAAQRYDFGVPLVKDRPGLLRVFVRANQPNTAAPAVRVRFYQGGALLETDTIQPHHAGVSQAINEADTTASWNLALPPLLIEPGLQILVDVDPTVTIPLATRAGLTYPGNGMPGALDVRSAGTYNLAFVPVFNQSDHQLGNVSPGNDSSFIRAVRLLHPMWFFSAAVHETYTFTGGVFQSADQNGAIAALLQQIEMLRLVDGSSSYYFGVMHLPYTAGEVGLGYINTAQPGSRAAVGWDFIGPDPLLDGSETYAHELGHNMGLFHAPCGGASSPDPNYPYPQGQVGVYGYNVQSGVVTGLQNNDMMGYCTPIWISDYSYGRMITLAPTLGSSVVHALASPVHGYLVSGTIRDGTVTVSPLLEVVTRPALPPAAGAWRMQGYAADGSVLFSYGFTPTTVGDAVGTLAQFAYVVPLDSSVALDHVGVTGPAASATIRRAAAADLHADSAVVHASRIDAGHVQLTWSAVDYPLLMIRDAATGAVVTFARGGSVTMASGSAVLMVTASDGVRSRVVRVTP